MTFADIWPWPLSESERRRYYEIRKKQVAWDKDNLNPEPTDAELIEMDAIAAKGWGG